MQRSRVLGVGLVLLLLTLVLSACGAVPVPQDWPGLTVDGDSVYVSTGVPRQVYILNAETGVQEGTFAPPTDSSGIIYWSPVTLGDGIAFVGIAEEQAGTAHLYAFDPATGQEHWRVPARNLILAAPTYAADGSEHPSGIVYFADTAGWVYAVDVETGSVLPGWPFQAEEAVWAAPLVVDDMVYVASMDHHVYALDTVTGAEIWSTSVGGAIAASPVFAEADRILYVGAFDGRVHPLRTDSGELVSGFDFRADNWIWSEPLLADDVLHVTSLDGRLYTLDRATGAVVPPYPYDSAEITNAADSIRAAPADAGDAVIIATESGRVAAVSNAQRLWTWPSGLPEAQIYTTPVVAGDLVYVVLMNGQVQALNVETGAPVWTFTPPEPG
ncbi:MAG TPA: PQQ-binding-like beta-propeller repeat protein [Anaerolineae bacterium]|nr:PQQ-binding-like beta-propeller repeat protein [Anaerolineae bacterium]